MRAAAVVMAIVLVLLGAVWIGQGLGYVKGSFMTGQPVWAVIGAVAVVAGAGLGAFSWRRR